MSFIPASQITVGSGEYLHAKEIGSATQQKYADMGEKKEAFINQKNMLTLTNPSNPVPNTADFY